MRRIILLATMAALMVVLTAASASPTLAKEKYFACAPPGSIPINIVDKKTAKDYEKAGGTCVPAASA